MLQEANFSKENRVFVVIYNETTYLKFKKIKCAKLSVIPLGGRITGRSDVH